MLFWHVCCVTVAGLFTIPELQLLICGKSVLQPVSWSHGEAHTGHCEEHLEALRVLPVLQVCQGVGNYQPEGPYVTMMQLVPNI